MKTNSLSNSGLKGKDYKQKDSYFIEREVYEMAKKKNKNLIIFYQIIRWLLLALGILFFLWLIKNLGWLSI